MNASAECRALCSVVNDAGLAPESRMFRVLTDVFPFSLEKVRAIYLLSCGWRVGEFIGPESFDFCNGERNEIISSRMMNSLEAKDGF